MPSHQRPFHQYSLNRRQFVLGTSSFVALSALSLPDFARANTATSPQIMTGTEFDLHVDYQRVNFTGRDRIATTVNNSFPGPTLYWKEGDEITIHVTNHLKNETSIHWHGIILPSEMDGVPGLSFAGIKPGETFEYKFTVKQYGTYWYHSHSNFQEQIGLTGAIIIAPKESISSVAYDRDLVVMLSDWSDESPLRVYSNLKRKSDYYNFRERTFSDTWSDIKNKGLVKTWKERAMWNQMRMSQTDISDVTGATYTYLMNGVTPASGWVGIFKPGEKLRLRIINGSGMSIFDVRIPGLKMTVIAADGQDIQPVIVDEFRIGTAEVYDVVVEPDAKQAYTLFAQTNDRSGFARGTLTADLALVAQVPAMDAAPLLTHGDMGMDMSSHDMSKMNTDKPAMDHSGHAMAKIDMGNMDMSHMDHDMSKMKETTPAQDPLARAGFGSNFSSDGNIIAANSGLADPGIGLRDHLQTHNRRVLTYADIRSLKPTQDKRQPTREIELHLMGNMHRYIWSIDGQSFMQAAPLQLQYGERVRIVLINDTMMTHPIHLHGMWSELETGDPDYIPRKHTIIVQPGSRVSYLVTADARGRWAYHCHLIYHMPGMMREVRVV